MTTAAASDLAAKRRIVAHTCAHCGAAFTAIKKARYCSERCRQAAKYQRGKQS